MLSSIIGYSIQTNPIINSYLLIAVILIPIVGSLFIMFIPKNQIKVIRDFSIFIATLNFIVSLGLLICYQTGTNVEVTFSWSQGFDFSLGLDGISLFFVLLSTFLINAGLVISNLI